MGGNKKNLIQKNVCSGLNMYRVEHWKKFLTFQKNFEKPSTTMLDQ